jgi:hypothetical protein
LGATAPIPRETEQPVQSLQRDEHSEYNRIYHPNKCEIIPMRRGENPESGQEVVITPAMLAAGVDMIAEIYGVCGADIAPDLARDVFKSMWDQSDQGKTLSGC